MHSHCNYKLGNDQHDAREFFCVLSSNDIFPNIVDDGKRYERVVMERMNLCRCEGKQHGFSTPSRPVHGSIADSSAHSKPPEYTKE